MCRNVRTGGHDDTSSLESRAARPIRPHGRPLVGGGAALDSVRSRGRMRPPLAGESPVRYLQSIRGHRRRRGARGDHRRPAPRKGICARERAATTQSSYSPRERDHRPDPTVAAATTRSRQAEAYTGTASGSLTRTIGRGRRLPSTLGAVDRAVARGRVNRHGAGVKYEHR